VTNFGCDHREELFLAGVVLLDVLASCGGWKLDRASGDNVDWIVISLAHISMRVFKECGDIPGCGSLVSTLTLEVPESPWSLSLTVDAMWPDKD
jgi:hypothetical protein